MMKIKFLGAAREVTGSKTQLTYRDRRYLVDCGLYQGARELRELNWEDLPHAAQFDSVFLTHAHLDHCGYLPRLVKQGFHGPIYCTEATAALVRVLLADAAHLQEEDAQYANESGYSRHRPALPLYTQADVEKTVRLLKIVKRDEWWEVAPGLTCRFLRSGHLLGSSFVQFNFAVASGTRVLTFSGDLGSERSYIIKGPVQVLETDYLVLESTYGDKVHKLDDLEKNLCRAIKHVSERRGVLLIPAFAVGRTQELVFLINRLQSADRIPSLPLYVDSPMALKATEIYSRFRDDLKLVDDGDRFFTSMDMAHFKAVTSPELSRRLTQESGPMIVVSAAGMLTGGRIMHHLKSRLPHRANAVLFVGFQAHGTKGRLLQNGIDRIRIHHEEVRVEAEILGLDGFSAHADSNELVEWVRGMSQRPAQTFLNHGESDGPRALKYRLQGELGLNAVEIPRAGDEFVLE